MLRVLALFVACFLSVGAWAGGMSFGYSPAPGPGEKPWFSVTVSQDVVSLQVVITAGGQSYRFEESGLSAGETKRFSWRRNSSVTTAKAHVLADYTDSSTEEQRVSIAYSFAAPLSVDLSRATADVSARTVSVDVTAHVGSAEITAYGAGKVVLDQSTAPIDDGPGTIEVPWVGNPADVVLLDVKLISGGSWAGFTFSPWFLDIPHDDVLFASNADAIPAAEEPKLRATLHELNDVLAKYGDLVPVKLYIAGCTDTVGDAAHNRDLSRRRARSIARWLRAHGYSKPIYYHGFGERLLAVGTGDGVDEPRNRRALYMVGANPPPSGSGVPSVSWTPL